MSKAKPANLIARVREHGFRVELGEKGPALVREEDGAVCPPRLLAELKEHRAAVVRHLLVRALHARAEESGKPLWGLVRGDPRPQKFAGRDLPADWSWACVEGDAEWTELPSPL